MKEHNKKDLQTIILTIFSACFAVVGLVILFWFLIETSKDFSVLNNNQVDLEKSAQTGDFIGGLVGSIWAFTGVLLFYLALRLQRKEFRLQKKELISQRTEFQINRITNIIFNQISRIENQIKSSEFNIVNVGVILGVSGIYSFNKEFDKGGLFIVKAEKIIKTDLYLLNIDNNANVILELFDLILNSTKIVNRILESTSGIKEKEKIDLKFVYNENLGNEVKNIIRYVHKITETYFYQKDREMKGKYVLTILESNYSLLKDLSKNILDEIGKNGNLKT